MRYFYVLDLLLKVLPISKENGEDESLLADATGSALETLVRKISIDQTVRRTEIAVKVILAPVDGYLCRSDILDVRMRHSEFVDTVISFGTWNKRLSTFSRYDKHSLLSLLLSSPGAIIPRETPESGTDNWALLHKDMETRLSFNWILPRKPASYKVALVAGRHRYEGGTYRAEGFLDAARALGIAITILDEPGHWLEGGKYAHLRDDFVAVNLSFDGGLVQRITDAVKGRDIDGIITFTDEYVLTTGEVAEALGLPAEPLHAMQQALHKDELRKVVNNTNIQAFLLQHAAQLDGLAFANNLAALQYPLIVKPAYGRASAGVKKVTDESSLREAVRLLTADGLDKEGILLETFVDGPELDCNFVLCDGEVLFLELTDDLPSAGDANDATLADNFFETAMISNSGLPASEQQAVRDSLQRSLRKLGLGWGVFHVEARMHNSSMRFTDSGDGIQELVFKDAPPLAEPDAFLIEVNVRPPGIGASFSTLYTYGIDYNALHLLRAVEDRERFVALSQGFRFPASAGGGGGAQYWAAHALIPVHRENILVPGDFVERVYDRVPDIVPYVSKAELHAKPGTMVSPSGGVGLMAYFLLFSRVGRGNLLEMYHRVAEASTAVLDEGL